MDKVLQPLNPHNVILFQGDSITDAGRSRSAFGPNSPDGLGFGYPRLIADAVLNKHPEDYLQFYNRGVSGDRIRDMQSRWELDTLRLQPDLISILIGVNDTSNYIYLGMGSDPGEFRQIYQAILDTTVKNLPDASLVLCEPFILLTGEVSEEWSTDIIQRQTIVKDLAKEYDAVLVPFQSDLDEKTQGVPANHLLDDGVHPTEQGHQILADCWIKTVLG
ncbi:MAG: SGNH/GDSL hydrolase family protein [Anaerolineales bacterium]